MSRSQQKKILKLRIKLLREIAEHYRQLAQIQEDLIILYKAIDARDEKNRRNRIPKEVGHENRRSRVSKEVDG